MQILYAIFGTLAAAIAVVGRVFFYHAGKQNAELKSAEKTIEDIEKANNATVRVRSDKSLADKLRERYKLK
jgi:hypothetical protein